MMSAGLDQIAKTYREVFVPAYAELVALTTYIPEQIFIENTNILAHLCQTVNPALDQAIQSKNLEKAENHLIRASVDLHKLIWAETRKQLDVVIKDPTKRLCFLLPEDEVLNKYRLFVQKGKEARRHELENVGNNPLDTIKYYIEANDIGKELYDNLDVSKLDSISFWKHAYSFRYYIISFFLGIIASIVAAIIFAKVNSGTH